MSQPRWMRIVLVGLLCVVVVLSCLALTYVAAVLGNITATPTPLPQRDAREARVVAWSDDEGWLSHERYTIHQSQRSRCA